MRSRPETGDADQKTRSPTPVPARPLPKPGIWLRALLSNISVPFGGNTKEPDILREAQFVSAILVVRPRF